VQHIDWKGKGLIWLRVIETDRRWFAETEVSFAPPMHVGRADEAILRAYAILQEHDAQLVRSILTVDV
jgi:hypothetical protein